VDANQAWTFNEAERRISYLARSHLAWIEEPIAADRPSEEWQHLTSIGPRLAAGENLRGKDAFQAALDAGVAVIQPDAIKWGGLSGAREVARLCRQHQVLWAPHYLAGGVGLAATAHLAVAQRASYLEMDVNPNPLRDGLLGDALTIEDGFVALADRPGHGATPDTELVDRYTIA
ncbi:MAG: enolase C-terminal domain-like protein, partial [Pseudomonadota bacterium]